MQMKSLVWIGLGVGSTIGGMIPLLWGGSALSMSSVILSAVGGMVGIWGGYRLGSY